MLNKKKASLIKLVLLILYLTLIAFIILDNRNKTLMIIDTSFNSPAGFMLIFSFLLLPIIQIIMALPILLINKKINKTRNYGYVFPFFYLILTAIIIYMDLAMTASTMYSDLVILLIPFTHYGFIAFTVLLFIVLYMYYQYYVSQNRLQITNSLCVISSILTVNLIAIIYIIQNENHIWLTVVCAGLSMLIGHIPLLYHKTIVNEKKPYKVLLLDVLKLLAIGQIMGFLYYIILWLLNSNVI